MTNRHFCSDACHGPHRPYCESLSNSPYSHQYRTKNKPVPRIPSQECEEALEFLNQQRIQPTERFTACWVTENTYVVQHTYYYEPAPRPPCPRSFQQEHHQCTSEPRRDPYYSRPSNQFPQAFSQTPPSQMPSNVSVQDRYPDSGIEEMEMLDLVHHQPALPLDQDARQSLPKTSEEYSNEEAHSHQENDARSESSPSVDSLCCDQDGNGPVRHDRLADGSSMPYVQPQPVAQKLNSSSATSGLGDVHKPNTSNHLEHSASTSTVSGQAITAPPASIELVSAPPRKFSREERRRLIAALEKQIETKLNQDGKYCYNFAGQHI